MLYDMNDMSKRIAVNKTNKSRNFIIYNCYYFLKVNFKFQPELCDGCHYLTQKL